MKTILITKKYRNHITINIVIFDSNKIKFPTTKDQNVRPFQHLIETLPTHIKRWLEPQVENGQANAELSRPQILH